MIGAVVRFNSGIRIDIGISFGFGFGFHCRFRFQSVSLFLFYPVFDALNTFLSTYFITPDDVKDQAFSKYDIRLYFDIVNYRLCSLTNLRYENKNCDFLSDK